MEITSEFSMNETATKAHDVPSFEANVIISVVIAILLVVGACGSLLTAAVICVNKHLHTKPNFFIFSLCLSDLISALVCSPLWTYRRTWGFVHWTWGDFACKFYWVADFSTNYLTSLHIVSFAALRFAAVKRPFLVSKISKRVTLCYICVLWLVASLSALPLGFLMGVDPDRSSAKRGSCWPSCSIADSKGNCCISQYNMYISIINPIMFYVPEILIVIFSFLIGHVILKKRRWRNRYLTSFYGQQKTTPRGGKKHVVGVEVDVIPNAHVARVVSCNTVCEEIQNNHKVEIGSIANSHAVLRHTDSGGREKSAFLQLSLIVLAYMIGYIPVTVYLLWSTATPKDRKVPDFDYWFGVVSYLFLRLSECMNPLMYNLGSSNISEASRKLVSRIFCCKKSG